MAITETEARRGLGAAAAMTRLAAELTRRIPDAVVAQTHHSIGNDMGLLNAGIAFSYCGGAKNGRVSMDAADGMQVRWQLAPGDEAALAASMAADEARRRRALAMAGATHERQAA